MRTFYQWAGIFAVAGLLALAGCGTPRETVTVSERPPTPTDTVTSPADTLTADASAASTVSVPTGYDTVQVGRFDRGKMWPINRAPLDHFRSAYDVAADSQWLNTAQRGALRFGDQCSASFASPQGLVLTNHHCARDALAAVSNGDSLLKNGFYADSLGAERAVPGLYLDQLVRIKDVTNRVNTGRGLSERMRRGSRQQRLEALEDLLTQKVKKEDDRFRVEIVELYHGARYAAYTYRRHDDVRVVMAPELQMGYFGGETDNFTYPRYSLDVAFFRVYADDGTPYEPEHYFSWDLDGAERGDPVFAVGNPGTTNRLDLPSQWGYTRDHQLPNRLQVLRHRRNLLKSYIANNPEEAATYDLRNVFFSVGNSIKSMEGQLNGLQDPYLMARRAKAVRALQDSMAAVDSLKQYNGAVSQIEQLQQSKRILSDKQRAFTTFASIQLGPRILARGIHGYYYDFLKSRGAMPERVQEIRTEAEKIENWPDGLEQSFLAAQFNELRDAFGPDHPTMRKLFRDRSPDSLAAHLVQNSALTDSSQFRSLLDDGYLKSDDPSVSVVEALGPLFLNTSRQMQDIQQTEKKMNRRLSQARLALYESRIPPEASFTLRISDGVVKGYPFNGSRAAPFTNFYGLYDRYFSHSRADWALPDRWVTPPDSLDLDTPLNLVSTNDISGGSSGSPLLNADLEIVGVVFDSNMQALPNTFLYRDREARAISVDVRGIVAALDDVYGATRIVEEVTGTQAPTAETRPSSPSDE
jgi:hypothetical protein